MMAVLNLAVAVATSTDTVPPIATPVKRRAVLTQGQAESAHGVVKLRTGNEMPANRGHALLLARAD
jgi:hypothetical protein